MESDGGSVTAAAAITPWRLISQPSTLREFFLTNDLGDTLKTINHNNHNPSHQRPKSRLTLGAVLNSDQKPPRTSKSAFFRTLLEAIKAEALKHRPKKSWKPFKSRDKLKRPKLPHFSYQNQNQNLNTKYFASSSLVRKSNWTFSSRRSLTSTNLAVVMKSSYKSNSLRGVETVPADDLALREITSGGSPRSGGSFRLSAAVAAEREETRRRLSRELVEGSMDEKKVEPTADGNEEDEEEDKEEDEEEEPHSATGDGQPMRMSLMDLLEETDRQAGISGPTYRLDDEEIDYEEEEEEEEEEHDTGKGEEYSCCVCNVKHRASAFKGCGHTFCRLCSRELDVQKGYCPQCNGFLLEVLDIF